MPTKDLFVTHLFNGGWATDYGPQYYGSPNADGTMPIPFLVDAKNVVYELDGGVHKCPGTANLNAAVIGDATTSVLGLYDYWRFGAAGNPLQKRVVYAGTQLYADAADGIFTSILTGLQSGQVPHFSTFNDLMIVGFSGTVDTPKQYDQTTAAALTGSPPRFSFSVKHRNKHWAAGDWTKPYRLYYSVDNNPQDWTGAGSGSIDIDFGDGDMIVGIASYKNELWVFKGPYKGSIHRITGSSPTGADSYARQTFVTGVMAAWQNAITTMGDDLVFMSPWGSIHSLKATSAYGNYTQAQLGFPLVGHFRNNLNFSIAKFIWAVDMPELGRVMFSVPFTTGTQNNAVVMMDYRFGVDPPHTYPRFALWDAFGWGSVARVIDSGSSNKPTLMAGTYTGRVVKSDQSTRTNVNTSINMLVTLPFLTYGAELRMKTLERVGLGFQPKNANNTTLSWIMDGTASQSISIAQGGSDILG